jgi:hypothetical protein
MQSAYNLSCTVCVNEAHNSPMLSYMSCVLLDNLDLHSATQVVSRLHATVLGKSCSVNRPLGSINMKPLSLSWTAADASYDDALYDDVSRPSISM